ncbi:MAG: D-alanyl-D-alanine carboxypeptidase/D-alanyl-D-alanine-endopeptidase [Flavobacteriales bacterium]|nr:D-alanyl-D-alanine carboxypeptidase/D-alanyl-D-alanine-endopeptidase [Flavobacteriales bacterium]
MRINICILSFLITFSLIAQSSTSIIKEKDSILWQKEIRSSDTLFTKKEKKVLSPREKTDSIIQALSKDYVLKNANWGFCVYDPETKQVLFSKDGEKAYIPASTNKLITTETALSLIGEDFRWQTQLDYTGEIDSTGVLKGDLFLVGNNDPTIGYNLKYKNNEVPSGYITLGGSTKYQFLSELYTKIKEKGIKKVDGKIIYEAVIFKHDNIKLPEGIIKFEKGNYYSIPSETEVENVLDDYKELVSLTEGDKSESFNNILEEKKELQKSSVYLPPAPGFLAKELRKYLTTKGIYTSNALPQDYSIINTSKERKTIYTHKSPPLKDVVKYVNQNSSNAFAEKLLTSVGFFVGGKQTKYTGIQNVLSHLETEKFDTNGLQYADGSGLSRENFVTPLSQVKYLANIMKKPYYDSFYDSLPKAGVSGTLRNTFTNSPAKGKVRAKTGTLFQNPINVKALAGYIDTESGKRLCFSLLVNKYTGSVTSVKERMQTLVESIVKY